MFVNSWAGGGLTFLFVRTFFGKTLRTRTREARPAILVDVSARSVHSGGRGERSKFFSGGSGQDDFPGFSTRGIFLYLRTGKTSSTPCLCTSTQPRHVPGGQQATVKRARRYNAAAHKHRQATPCVCDAHIRAVLLFIRACGL